MVIRETLTCGLNAPLITSASTPNRKPREASVGGSATSRTGVPRGSVREKPKKAFVYIEGEIRAVSGPTSARFAAEFDCAQTYAHPMIKIRNKLNLSEWRIR